MQKFSLFTGKIRMKEKKFKIASFTWYSENIELELHMFFDN